MDKGMIQSGHVGKLLGFPRRAIKKSFRVLSKVEKRFEERLARDKYSKIYLQGGGELLNRHSREYREFYEKIKRFNKVVIWGFRTQEDTFRYILNHFFIALKKSGANVIWVDDDERYADLIEENDLVLSVNVAGYHMPIKSNVFYCLHNFDELHEGVHDRIHPSKNIRLQVYTNKVLSLGIEKWDDVTYFDKDRRCLYQPWGTNLFPDEFKEPVFRENSKYVFWVGSIWNNPLGQGNLNEIERLRDYLGKKNMKFVHIEGIPNFMNIALVRASRIAPSIAGHWQAENGYLPCRMFKNISYGQLGISNVKMFDHILKDCHVDGDSIEERIENALDLPRNEYLEKVRAQQEVIKNHTYLHRLINIMGALERI